MTSQINEQALEYAIQELPAYVSNIIIGAGQNKQESLKTKK
jgi:hypothetical protein